MKITKNKIIAFAVILAVLAASFWYGGGAPGLQGWNVSQTPKGAAADSAADKNPEPVLPDNAGDKGHEDNPKEPADDKAPVNEEPDDKDDEIDSENNEADNEKKEDENQDEEEEKPADGIESRPRGTEGGLSASEKIELAKEMAGGASSPGMEKGSKDYSLEQGMVIDAATGKDKYLTDPVPEGKPVPVEPQNIEISDVEYTCTISVRCDTILDNIDWLDKEKVELVPEDGVIFPAAEVTFYEGESVFNVLQREMKKARIHMEFSSVPMYNSVYIEGINNLYEFDCGELSGWMYKVNSWFPNYGCSRYLLKDGDVVEWVYTCDLGVDVGGFYAVGE